MSDAKKLYGYHLGEIVENVLELYDECGIRVDYGARLRLVAFAPKVRVIRSGRFLLADEDRKHYFFNAVRADQKSDHGQRIRANFCTIRKIKKGKA